MNIGIPKEIKPQEYRVAATPGAVHALTSAGHRVLVEAGAGLGSSFPDEEYLAAGAELGTVSDAWSQQLVLKVKEPIASEYGYLRPDLLLFTYLHLAADRALTDALVASRTTAVAYETVQLANGTLPLLTPMSEVAGRMAPQVGAHFLERAHGGKGVLLAGVPGVQTGVVTIIGAGVVGTNSAKISLGLGARVNLLDVSHSRLQYLDDVVGGRVQTMASNLGNLRE
ncbi:MAG TPA: alanine dehydrogenase, partial [Trueperaceae bacterium]|nr:alanine dehydrogenase [Trueperaceae bacterium]